MALKREGIGGRAPLRQTLSVASRVLRVQAVGIVAEAGDGGNPKTGGPSGITPALSAASVAPTSVASQGFSAAVFKNVRVVSLRSNSAPDDGFNDAGCLSVFDGHLVQGFELPLPQVNA
jgi:hypothetical protein